MVCSSVNLYLFSHYIDRYSMAPGPMTSAIGNNLFQYDQSQRRIFHVCYTEMGVSTEEKRQNTVDSLF